MVDATTAPSATARAWGFQVMLIASGTSDAETAAKSELLALVASESRLASWSRLCSFRVVARSDVEALARKAKREELEAAAAVANAVNAANAAGGAIEEAQRDDDGTEQEPSDAAADALEPSSQMLSAVAAATALADSASTKAISTSVSNPQLAPTTEQQLVSMELTPQILANAFQRLVQDDKTAFLAHVAATLSSALAPNTGADEASATATAIAATTTSADMNTSSPLSEFITQTQQQSESNERAPARIYFLAEYPSSLDEIRALLHTGEAGSTAFQGDLPLLPLIDGTLLITDPAKALHERRKSLSLSEERRKSISQKRMVANAIEDSMVPAAAALSVFQTSNTFVKACYEASIVGGLEWSDFVFAELPCSATESTREPKETAELAKKLLVTTQTLAAHKYEFKHWVSTTMMIPIPAYCPESEDAQRTLEFYEQILSGVYEASVSVSTVIFAMKEAVVAAGESGEVVALGDVDGSNQSFVEEFIAHRDNAALRLAVAYATFIEEHQAVAAGSSNSSSDGDDPCSVLGRKIEDVEKEMWTLSDLPGVGNSGRKCMPIKPQLTPTERSIQDTEFALFSRFDVPSVHLTQQLLQFEELLGPAWRGRLQQTRGFVEEMDREVLPQRLAQILGNFPTMYKHYDAATDSLLVATLAATAPGRFRTATWSAKDHVRHRPAFKDWKKEQLLADEYLTPRTTKALGACVPLSSAELGLLSEKTSVLFPSDQSVIRLYQTPRGDAWLNVYQGGDVFGFRQIDKQNQRQSRAASRHALQFCASFDDNSQLHVREGRSLCKKPDGFPTITATNTFPNGLTVTACSDGTIVQQYVSALRHVAPGSSPLAAEQRSRESESDREIYRLIVGKGAVLREFASGERIVLLANGDVQRVARASRAAATGVTATDASVSSNDAIDDELAAKPLRVVDPATNALVEKRPDGVVIVTHTDGSRVTHHTDGTRMFTNGAKSHVLVTKAGFAEVCIDIQVNLTAQRHARGERVAVTKGGLRTRSIVDVHDGTRIEVSYNTKVIAQVNGRVTTRKPSGVCVIAKDSGRIEYRPPRSIAPGTAEAGSTEDDDLDVTSHNGVYYFDCLRGRFQLCDHEQNQFAVDLVGDSSSSSSSSRSSGSARVTVDLAGVVSDADAAKYEISSIPAKAVVNDPIEPHLLVLNGDGTGKEILRPRDVEQFLSEDAAHTSEVYSALEPHAEGATTTQHRVFFQQLQPSAGSSSSGDGSRALFNDAKLQSEFEKLFKSVNAAAKHLQQFYYPGVQPPVPQFTVVRKIQQIQPFSASQLQEMHAAVAKWREWQHEREANKNQYKVVDPRDNDTIAQQVAVQKKVLAAYKAARSRRKLEKQKARELLKKKKQQLSQGGGASGLSGGVSHMETVQEGGEPHVDSKDDDDHDHDHESDGDDFDNLSSDGDSTNGDDLDDEMDDPEELLWTAFADADATSTGRLSVAQTRQALVTVLGVGVPTSELATALQRYKLQEPLSVSFDTFADLVSIFSSANNSGDGDEQEQSSNNSNSSNSSLSSPRLLALHGLKSTASNGPFVAAGSATEAIRLKQKKGNN